MEESLNFFLHRESISIFTVNVLELLFTVSMFIFVSNRDISLQFFFAPRLLN